MSDLPLANLPHNVPAGNGPCLNQIVFNEFLQLFLPRICLSLLSCLLLFGIALAKHAIALQEDLQNNVLRESP